MKLGTRRSLLAMSQSRWVAKRLQELHPDLEIELVGIDTKGDQIQDVPLQSVEGKDFFVKEIDDALLSGRVDFTVHSMKDLSLERPKEIQTGAIPTRENPRDVLLVHESAVAKLQAGHSVEIKIGTSSPRRLENLPPFLSKAIPGNPRLKFVEIRGNVNTRVSRLHEPEGSTQKMDGVVLALAGLNRLWADAGARIELTKLLKGVRWMVLPLRQNPVAPAQGALAIECRTDDIKTHGILSSLHDRETAHHVAIERVLLEEWGGGCHQRFGATALRYGEVGTLFFVRGVRQDYVAVDELRWKAPALRKVRGVSINEIWDGSKFKPTKKENGTDESKLQKAPAIFIAHSRALPDGWSAKSLAQKRVWTSGATSWFQLAQRGIWVEGCSEGFGFDFLSTTLNTEVLQLPKAWVVLTHEDAEKDWKKLGSDYKIVPTYEVDYSDLQKSSGKGLAEAKFIYWASGSQFDALSKFAPKEAFHSCGTGKTAQHLFEREIQPIVFPNPEEWRKWVDHHRN